MSVAEEQKITLPEKVQDHIIYIGYVLAMYKMYIYIWCIIICIFQDVLLEQNDMMRATVMDDVDMSLTLEESFLAPQLLQDSPLKEPPIQDMECQSNQVCMTHIIFMRVHLHVIVLIKGISSYINFLLMNVHCTIKLLTNNKPQIDNTYCIHDS